MGSFCHLKQRLW